MNKQKKERGKGEVWLNLGCGVLLADPPFINVDKYFSLEELKTGVESKDGAWVNARLPEGVKFQQASMTDLPFEDNSVDYVESNDAIEHLSWNEVDVALKEMYRVLKPGGKLALGTTNFDELAKLWTLNITGNPLKTQVDIDRYISLTKIIYGNQVHPGEFHRVPFNPYSIAYRLQNAGFALKDILITMLPTGSPITVVPRAVEFMEEELKKCFVATEGMWIEVNKQK